MFPSFLHSVAHSPTIAIRHTFAYCIAPLSLQMFPFPCSLTSDERDSLKDMVEPVRRFFEVTVESRIVQTKSLFPRFHLLHNCPMSRVGQ